MSASSSQSPEKPESRAERLARIKAEIEAGTYDTPEKMEAALDRMIGSVLRDEQPD